MNRVENYDAYRSNFYEKTGNVKEADRRGRAAEESRGIQSKEVNDAGRTGAAALSERAKNLLKELKKKYGNMDFIISDYETDEEAERYLSRGTGEYSVLLTPDELEKMAADEDYKKQNLNTLDDAVSKLGEMKVQLGGRGQEVSRVGIAIDDEGKVSYFAELEKVNEKQRERIEKKREIVKADSVEALQEKIKEVDWSTVKPEEEQPAGRKIDFMA